MNDASKAHVRALLEAQAADIAAEEQEIRELEANGYRIVDGGQDGSYDTQNRCAWSTADWRTGEVLVSGFGTIEEMEQAVEAADPEGRWVHRDGIGSEDGPEEVETEGVPASLAGQLANWIGMKATTDEEVAEFAGLPVQRVKEARRDPRFSA